jgi:sugar O-acyltransferase (sialic acid O-acetyltransferase NeuD family)
MKDLIFWGATGQARVLREALPGSEYRLLAVFDNRLLPSPFSDVPLHVGRQGFESWLRGRKTSTEIYACVAIGGARGADRLEIQEWLGARGILPLIVIHPRAFVAVNTRIGEGSQILAMSAVCANASIGRAVIINTSSSIDHDCVVGDGVHVAPGASITGEVDIGDYAFIGAGAVILPRLRIGKGAVVGAGAVVTSDVPPGCIVAGSPAKSLVQKPD